ncbi:MULTISPECIES: LTA synthase family protein [Paenibacillus]|uniref:Sulfatase n=2 Tax=Paenibacillus lactis TaxID=228574 RepID=G4HCK0_9BACL|nr:LTA synthase family protein [Paenibacillus lactis]EHB65776.1 sulfatase [Paenibacillus lactis 154]MBP1891159.1 phosphoglycerol transferase MdoB-like AlkP superfamily enzyme [Paenibacillus lactis]HAF98467.1 LTA synthase family protein [Paenibacillus lactis]
MFSISRFRLTITKPFIFFSVIMLLKSYLAWVVIFDDVLPWRPLITEIPFIWLVFSLIEWFASKRKLAVYMGVNLLLTAIFFAAIMYYKYYGVIVTYHALEQVNQVTAVSNSVFSLMDPYYLLIFTDIIVLFVLLWRSDRVKNWKNRHTKKEKRKFAPIMFVLSLMLCLFQIMPNRASMNEIVKAQEMGILNYEAYTIFQQENKKLEDAKAITQARINELKGLQPAEKPVLSGAAKGKNLIIIQMESFQNFLIDLKIDGKEITPNMNKLARESLYFPNFFQNVGQGNTSDAEFVVNTSFYIPPRGAATQHYADRVLPSLPRLMQSQGYDTATFHTNVVEFWNRGELYKALGFNRYYDKAFFGEDDKLFFGASDDALYTKTAAELEKMHETGKPFYTQIISMSAHHPFTIPEEKYRMTLPERYEGTFVGDYIRAQNYADDALGKFIEQLKKDGIWDDSLIVVYGDHLGLPIYSLDNKDKELMQEIYGREYTSADMINIPLMIHGNGLEPAVKEQVGGQIDLLPTIANLLGAPLDDQLHFGQDLLNHADSNLLPERYYLPSGTFINNTTMYIPGIGFEDGTKHPLPHQDKASTQASREEFERALQLLHLSDSYVRQLPLHK